MFVKSYIHNSLVWPIFENNFSLKKTTYSQKTRSEILTSALRKTSSVSYLDSVVCILFHVVFLWIFHYTFLSVDSPLYQTSIKFVLDILYNAKKNRYKSHCVVYICCWWAVRKIEISIELNTTKYETNIQKNSACSLKNQRCLCSIDELSANPTNIVVLAKNLWHQQAIMMI